MSVEIDVLYDGELRCTATHGPSKDTLMTDAPLDNGGKAEKFSPTDLVATALGTCIMTIMGLFAKKSNIDLTGTKVHVTKEMVSKPKRRIGELNITITYPKGLNMSDADKKKFEKVVDLCPVKQSLHPGIKVEAEFVYQ